MSTYWTQQGCYITYASQVSSREQGSRTIIGEPCSTRVGDIIGNDAYIALYAVMIPFNIICGSLEVYRLVLAIRAAREKKVKLWEHDQTRLYFFLVMFTSVYILWCLDPEESLGLFGEFGGNLILRTVVLSALFVHFNISTRVWVPILNKLNLIQFSQGLVTGFYIVFSLLAIFGILPIQNPLVRGIQYLASYGGFLVVGVFNMYYGFKVLRYNDKVTKERLKIVNASGGTPEAPADTSIDNPTADKTQGTETMQSSSAPNPNAHAKNDAKARRKIVLISFGISSQFILVFFGGSTLGIRYLLDALRGANDLNEAVILTATQMKAYYLVMTWITVAAANLCSFIILYVFAKIV